MSIAPGPFTNHSEGLMSRPGSRFRRRPVTRPRAKNYETRNPFTPSWRTPCQVYHAPARRLQLHGAPCQRIFREIFEQFWHYVQCMPDRLALGHYTRVTQVVSRMDRSPGPGFVHCGRSCRLWKRKTNGEE